MNVLHSRLNWPEDNSTFLIRGFRFKFKLGGQVLKVYWNGATPLKHLRCSQAASE